MLLEENTGAIVEECRIRYHADNVVVSLVLDDAGRAEVRAAVQRARELRASLERPPVTTDERKCVR
jgi:CRISPR-associated protein Cas1